MSDACTFHHTSCKVMLAWPLKTHVFVEMLAPNVQGAQQHSKRPLELLHAVLKEVAARLALVHMSSWVSQQSADTSSRWHRHIGKGERGKESRLDYGMRCVTASLFHGANC